MSEELFEEVRGMSEEDQALVMHGIESLDDEERRLQGLSSHGIGMGASEFVHVALHHPDLSDFFDAAPQLLGLSPEQDAEFLQLTKEYLAGSMAPERSWELKQKFYIPYMRMQRKKTQ